MSLGKVCYPFLCALLAAASAQQPQWIQPTPQELAMTSIPEVPGAAAVYLNKEELTDATGAEFIFYARIKILNEKGKDYANVELPFTDSVDGASVKDIAGRTIHPDGTVVPFTGKPYEKLVEKTQDYKEKAKVFTLPAVDVGSIIEYRYRIAGYPYEIPIWFLQSDLFTRHTHFVFIPKPAGYFYLRNGRTAPGRIVWVPILPPGVAVQAIKPKWGDVRYELTAENIAPLPEEDYMPPVHSVSLRVLFYDTPFATVEEYWKETGETWSERVNDFIGPKRGVTDFANSLIANGDTQDIKARKLYAAVMKLENTDYTRERTARENKSQGFKELKTTDDLLKRGRGDSDQLTQLFVAMARAVGLKAWVMGVANREQRLWINAYMSFRQVDDYIAIVEIDGKDVFFDPGERFCAAEQLGWRHSSVGGIRQTATGTALAGTPGELYKNSTIDRVADLKLEENGDAAGTVRMTYTGEPALRWRHVALLGDLTRVKDEMRTELEKDLPQGMDVKLIQIDNLDDYEKPLRVLFALKGNAGSAAGKRLLLPADLFTVNSRPLFTAAKREIAIDLHYPLQEQDAVRYILPGGLAVESSPEAGKTVLKQDAAFAFKSESARNSITTYRDLVVGKSLFAPPRYDELRDFYTKLGARDQESIVLRHATPAAPTPTGK